MISRFLRNEDGAAIMPFVHTTPEIMHVSPGVTVIDKEEAAFRPISIRIPSATQQNGNMIEKLDELRDKQSEEKVTISGKVVGEIFVKIKELEGMKEKLKAILG